MGSMENTCSLCEQLGTTAYACQKFGHESENTYLPAALSELTLLLDLQPYGSRKHQLLQCPVCGTCYLYRSDYTYLVNGSEDEEFLERLDATQAAAYFA